MIAKYGLRIVALGLPGAAPDRAGRRSSSPHTFSGGLAPVWDALTPPDAVQALELTLEIAIIVVPLNTLFGITMAILMVRRSFPGKALLTALIDLPFAVSPVDRRVHA